MVMNQPFKPSPYLDDKVNANIARSEIEGGAYLKTLAVGSRLLVVTELQVLTIENRADGFWISGHPEICPQPRLAYIAGSTWGGSMLKMDFIGVGMRLEFKLAGRDEVFRTSEILDVQEG